MKNRITTPSHQADATTHLWESAKALVLTKIKGDRKGQPGIPAYAHSLRVSEHLRHEGFDDETCIAGLLHDIIEDGGVTFEELALAGFSTRTIDLIHLCTHDASITNSDRRWTLMMGKLAEANNPSAWGIKIADLHDNVRDSAGLSPARRAFMLNVKAPLMLAVTEDVPEVSVLRKALEDEVAQCG